MLFRSVTANVRFRTYVLQNVSLYEYYDIREGDTPEIISEKVYGTPLYHWTIMIANQKYDYAVDYPLTAAELAEFVTYKYGDFVNGIHHYVEASTGLQKEGVNQLTLTNVTAGAANLIKAGVVLTNDYDYKGGVTSIITASNGTTVTDRKSTRLNSSHTDISRMPSSA